MLFHSTQNTAGCEENDSGVQSLEYFTQTHLNNQLRCVEMLWKSQHNVCISDLRCATGKNVTAIALVTKHRHVYRENESTRGQMSFYR